MSDDPELAEHLTAAFPGSIADNKQYGRINPKMSESDILAYVTRADLDPMGYGVLRVVSDNLQASLDDLPPDARPYFERLLRIARRKTADH